MTYFKKSHRSKAFVYLLYLIGADCGVNGVNWTVIFDPVEISAILRYAGDTFLGGGGLELSNFHECFFQLYTFFVHISAILKVNHKIKKY